MATVVKYNAKKRTYTGTNENDVLDASLLGYEPIGKTNIKKNMGLTITGGNGDDEITGTDYNDTIKGGNGNDTITGGLGVDTITGGAGKNVINYSKGDGNDIINLTKGENFTLNFTDLTKDDLRFEFANKNKDLRIYTSKSSDDEYITIKNFVKKDVTNNSNNKHGISDTSSVELMFNNVESSRIDLRTATDLYKTKVSKNYTGTWLSEEIDASDTVLYKKVKQGKKKVTVEKDVIDAGLTLKGDKGDDALIGTKYSDKIYGNTGADIINAGTGNNYIYLNKGDGNDIIENGGGVDTLVFAKNTNLEYNYDKYDLIIKYSDNDTVTLKDYLKGHSVQYVQIGSKMEEFNPTKPEVEKYIEDYMVFNGTEISDEITGTSLRDKIYGNDGNDIINAGLDDDIIDGGLGDDTYIFSKGDGNDIILNGFGQDKIVFSENYDKSFIHDVNDNDLIINYGDTDFITLKDYFSLAHSVKKIGDSKLSELIDGNINEIYTLQDNGEHTDIVSNGGQDTLIFPTELDLSYEHDMRNNDLVIKYGNSSVTLKDYYLYNHSVTKIGNNNISDLLQNNVNEIYTFTNSGQQTTITNTDGFATLNFNDISDLSYTWSDDKKDLILNYNNNADSITIKNFDLNNQSIQALFNDDKRIILSDLIRLNFSIFDSINSRIYYSEKSDIVIFEDNGFDIRTCYGNEGNDYITNNGIMSNILGGTGNDIIINNAKTQYINGDENDDLIINSGTCSYGIFSGTGNDTIINLINATTYRIEVDSGNNTIVNDGVVSTHIYCSGGNDIITNNGQVLGRISCGSGDNTIITGVNSSAEEIWLGNTGHNTLYLNASINNLYTIQTYYIYNWSDDDLVISYNDQFSATIKDYDPTNEDIVVNIGSNNTNLVTLLPKIVNDNTVYDIYADTSKIIINNGTVNHDIIGGNAGELITNNGSVKRLIQGNDGNDTIVNKADGTVFEIDGNDGEDSITNNGTVYCITGGAGNDTIINNNILNGYIYAGSGDDTIIMGENSSIDEEHYTQYSGGIWFYNGDGDDILYLNAKKNKLTFVETGDKIYSWAGDDLVIGYNNGNDSVTIKDYNPVNTNVLIRTGTGNTEYIDLSTLVPDKPVVQSLSHGANMLSMNELNSQVAAFTNTNSDISLNYNDLQNTSDTSSLIAEYTPDQPQVM